MGRRVATGVVMLNMGGPARLQDVNAFLRRLFSDNELIDLGRWQSLLGPVIANVRTPAIKKHYDEIGGGSPIGHWTRLQGEQMAAKLDALSPGTAPHKAYTAFRYAEPLTEHALMSMADDGVEHAIAFSQYPQYSCTTSGSSLNNLWRETERLGVRDRFKWSVIDRWHVHEGYIGSVAACVQEGLKQVPESVRDDAVIVFTSHSLPLKVVERGDPYPQQMAATVQSVMQAIGYSHPYVHAWQSKVGRLPWIGPGTDHTITGLAKSGRKHLVVVPLGFTSDHVETLYELDIQYAETARKAGIATYVRAPSLNDSPLFTQALADIVHDHMRHGRTPSRQYLLKCAHCTNPRCRTVVNPYHAQDQRAPIEGSRQMAQSA